MPAALNTQRETTAPVGGTEWKGKGEQARDLLAACCAETASCGVFLNKP